LGVAQDFDGTLDHIRVPDSLNNRLGIGDFTTSVWIKAADENQVGAFLSKRRTSSPFTQLQLTVGTPQAVGSVAASKKVGYFLIDNNITDAESAYTTADVLNGDWKMLTSVRSGLDTLRLYTDGVEAATTSALNTGGQPYDLTNFEPWTIGNANNSSFFDGQIDEVRIASTTRSTAWISAEYTNQSTTTNFYNTNQNEEWNANEWTLYDTITIDNTVIDEALTDFPVYVDLSDLSTQFWNTVTDGGGDIRVTTNANVELAREMVSASTTAMTGELHFKADSISATTDTTFKVWYNGSAGDYSTDATYGAQNVWTNDFVAVWHLGEDLLDSTGNGFTATASGTPTSTPTGYQFDGEDVLLVDNSIGVYIQNEGDVTALVESASEWSSLAGNRQIFDGRSGSGSGWEMKSIAGSIEFSIDTGPVYTVQVDPVGAGRQWFRGDYDGATARIFATSTVGSNTAATGVADISSSNFQMGNQIDLTQPLGSGVTLLQLRISSTTRTAAWISAEYTNQSTTTNFYNINQNEEWNANEWTAYDTITIDNTVIDETLTDFPVYVDLSDLSTQFWNTVTDGGGDIRVTTNTNVELAREVVSASTTLNAGELHFKADTISATTDTTFKVWYNGSAGDYATDATYGAQNVWTGYDLVSHDGLTDSTANQFTGTANGNASSTNLGRVGSETLIGGGTGDYVNFGDIGLHGTSYLTVSLWAKRFGSGTNAGIFSNRTGAPSTDSHTGMRYDSTGANSGGTNLIKFGQQRQSDLADREEESSNNVTLVDTWQHFVYQAASSTGNPFLSIDGTLNTTAAVQGVPRPGGISLPTFTLLTGSTNQLQGQIDEVRVASTSRSDAWIKAEHQNQSTTTDFYNTNNGVSRVVVTIDDHTVGQVDNTFNFQNKTNEALFAFSLGADSSATVDSLAFDATGLKTTTLTDFSNIRLFKDHNNNATYDGTDEQVGGVAVVSQTGVQKGTITFDTDFTATSSTNYILVADWSVFSQGSFLFLDLKPKNISAFDADGTAIIQGAVRSIQHARNNRGGGGSAAAVGGAAAAGNSNVGGGTNDGGDAIDTNTGGGLIGNSPNFKRPTAASGNWNSLTNAYDQTDGTYATTSAANDADFTNYTYSIPGTDTINGIEVKLEVSGTTAAGSIAVSLSWDGGTSWTATKNTATLSTTDTVLTVGGAADTWGRTWTASELSNANFAVRLTGAPSVNTIQVDAIQVRVHNQATGGGGGGGGRI
jgi:hypothetical protein